MRKKLTYEEALFKMAALCSTAEHCEQEIEERLKRLEIEEGDRTRILQRLKEERYIDAQRYAHAFVNDKMKYAQWGANKIIYALKKKNIPDSIIRDEIAEIDQEAFVNQAEELLQKKLASLRYKNRYDAKTKLFRFGVSRGIGMDILSKIVNKITANINNDEYDDDF